MKTKKEIQEIILFARKKTEELNKEHSFNCYFEIKVALQTIENYVLDVNPFRFDMRSRSYFGTDIMDGKLKTGTFW